MHAVLYSVHMQRESATTEFGIYLRNKLIGKSHGSSHKDALYASIDRLHPSHIRIGD